MPIHDIVSNYNPKALMSAEAAAGSGGVSYSEPIDLSSGTTSLILINASSSDSLGFAGAKFGLEFSTDEAFTLPVEDTLSADPQEFAMGLTDSGNQLLKSDRAGNLAGYDGTESTLLQGILVVLYVRILAAPSVVTSGDTQHNDVSSHYRYARVSISNSKAAAARVSAFGFTGPQRFVK
jgi:hypothetical protein